MSEGFSTLSSDAVARRRRQLRGEARAQQYLVALRRARGGVGAPVKLPEALVHAVDLHRERTPPARLVRHDALGDD